jgi:hypothetical protein
MNHHPSIIKSSIVSHPSPINSQSPIISHRSSKHQSSNINRQPSIVNQQSTINRQSPIIKSPTTNHQSPTNHHESSIVNHQ